MVPFGKRILICLVVWLSAVPLFAQEWSAEQKEAWASEVGYWKAVAENDTANAVSFLHDDYRGWNYGGSVPGSKESSKISFSHFSTTTKTFFHNPTPIAILVRGNVAVVHYVISFHSTNEKGEHETTEDRWTDTLIKEGGKWLLLGDHGGPTSTLRRAN
jgi:ketosteroid isomerase-like protein